MGNYIEEENFAGITYGADAMQMLEFEQCTFTGCDFSACTFMGVIFIDCVFTDCNFRGAGLNHTALRNAEFIDCDLSQVNFAMIDKTIFEVSFTRCSLRYSQFYGLRLSGTRFVSCDLVAADFMSVKLEKTFFGNCDLHQAVFLEADLRAADFSSARNFVIDPSKNRMKGARFSREGLPGLLVQAGITVLP